MPQDLEVARRRLKMVAVGAGLTATLVLGYVVCWCIAATLQSAAFTHAWLSLFSAAPEATFRQLLEGTLWSFVAAWFAAITFTPVFNWFSGSGARS